MGIGPAGSGLGTIGIGEGDFGAAGIGKGVGILITGGDSIADFSGGSVNDLVFANGGSAVCVKLGPRLIPAGMDTGGAAFGVGGAMICFVCGSAPVRGRGGAKGGSAVCVTVSEVSR